MTKPQKSNDFASLPPSALRMIDANLNRAVEGLRVAEDYCRFGLNDQHLSGRFKTLRHDLISALAKIHTIDLAAARDTQHDVGTSLSTPEEGVRKSLLDISAAACQRVQQALRVIEECVKLSDAAAASQIEALRYKAYTLAKALVTAADSRQRLDSARLYVLIDGKNSECAFVEHVQTLIAAGVDILQLRDKQLDDRALLGRARLLRRIIDEQSTTRHSPLATHRPLFIVNDRPDLAVLALADGVHVGQDELPVHDVRQIVGPKMLIGVSTHSIEQARQAVLDGASYLGCGPVFPSATKHFDTFPGLEFLKLVATEIALPAFAIGGITPEHLPLLQDVGFGRVALANVVSASQRPAEVLAVFNAALKPVGRPDRANTSAG